MLNKIRRISLFAGPSCGKSTAAAWLFAELKKRDINIELVTEYIKSWTYIDRRPKKYDQSFICTKQMQREFMPLEGGFQYIITDCPVLLSPFYGQCFGSNFVRVLAEMVDQFDRDYPSLNIFLERDHSGGFSEIGRFHDLEQAVQIDSDLKIFLNKHIKQCYYFNTFNLEEILKFILGIIKN